MLNTIIPIFITLFLTTVSASANQIPSIPDWLQDEINEYENQPLISSPITIYQTHYEDKSTYYIPARCCDIPSQLRDEKGLLICYPSGGFAGGDGKCPSFSFMHDSSSIVWRNKRKK